MTLPNYEHLCKFSPAQSKIINLKTVAQPRGEGDTGEGRDDTEDETAKWY